jgi:hypothetical protein
MKSLTFGMLHQLVIRTATRALKARLELIFNGRCVLPRTHFRCILIGDAPEREFRITL